MMEMIIRKINKNQKLKSQAYSWAEEWQKAEREADEDIKAGRGKKFKSASEAVKYLEGKYG